MNSEPVDLDNLPPTLAAVFEGLARPFGYVDHDGTSVAFLTDDCYLEVRLLRWPGHVLAIIAVLLESEGFRATEDDVSRWVRKQPKPALGELFVESRNGEDGRRFQPALAFDVIADAAVSEFIAAVIAPFAEAWDTRTTATATPLDDVQRYRHDPVRIAPQNAWILMGDEASFPDQLALAEARDDAQRGVYEWDWTAPKNGAVGDLVLVYFVAPRSAACFVARLASMPFWDDSVEVNALARVDPHQWWAFLTPPIEIEPIPFAALRTAAGGHLLLRGRSGHYLAPDVIERLLFRAKDPALHGEMARVAQRPVGDPLLPRSADLTFEQWREIPSGALPLEAKVSEYIVKPLARLLGMAPHTLAPLLVDALLIPEFRNDYGFVDFVITLPRNPDIPLVAVEVKLAIKRSAAGEWADSPDVQQLLSYMKGLDVPGLLIDAHRILLFPLALDEIVEIVRSQATAEDLARIATLILDSHERKTERPRQRATRRVARRG